MPSTADNPPVRLAIEVEREDDGRWLAEVPDLPGVLAYGPSADEACAAVRVLALRVIADRIEHGEDVPEAARFFEVAPA